MTILDFDIVSRAILPPTHFPIKQTPDATIQESQSQFKKLRDEIGTPR